MAMLKNLQIMINKLIWRSLIHEIRFTYFLVVVLGTLFIATSYIAHKYYIWWLYIVLSISVIIIIFLIAKIKDKVSRWSLYRYVRFERMIKYIFLALFICVLTIYFDYTKSLLPFIAIYITFYCIMNYKGESGIIKQYNNLLISNEKLEKFRGINVSFIALNTLTSFLILFLVFNVCLFLNNQFIEIIMSILFLLFIFINRYVSIMTNKKLEDSTILIKNYNINYDKLLNTAIINLGVSDSYQIVLIDLSSIFPASSTEKKAYVINQFCYFDKAIESSETLAVALPRCKVNKKLNIYYTYKQQDGKTKKRKCSLYISIESNSNMTYIANYKLKDFKVALIRYDKCLNYLKNKKFNSLYIPLNSIKYNVEITDERKFNSKLEPRKWLLHDDKFGAGKSVYDLNYIMNLGLQPVIISPWEENYDRDLLQLIFNRLSKKYSHSFSFFPPRNLLPFVCVCFAGVALFLLSDQMQPIYNFILSFVAKDSLPNCESFKEGICLLKHLLNILILILSWFFIMMFLPSIIILKKDSSKIYQDYYIEKIRKILNENKFVCILIEDVDRLDFAVHNEIFRILSLINKVAYNREFFIGIISLDKKLMEDSKTCFESIENKLIGYNIGTNYSQSESVKIYMNDGLKFLQKYSKKDLEVMCENIVKENFKNKELNFRDAKLLMNMLIQNIIEEKKSNI